jgi:hypothetical protein
MGNRLCILACPFASYNVSCFQKITYASPSYNFKESHFEKVDLTNGEHGKTRILGCKTLHKPEMKDVTDELSKFALLP